MRPFVELHADLGELFLRLRIQDTSEVIHVARRGQIFDPFGTGCCHDEQESRSDGRSHPRPAGGPGTSKLG